MDDEILITQLNDFIFCPVSIYFHNLYADMNTTLFQSEYQVNGTNAHQSVDQNTYTTSKSVLCGISVYSQKYRLVGKIDQYDARTEILTERKRTIKTIYDGYVFQLYAQCIAMREMGYEIKKIRLYSMTDNKSYNIPLPEDDKNMMGKFESTIFEMRNFNMDDFHQTNADKCEKCIYEPACDRCLTGELND